MQSQLSKSLNSAGILTGHNIRKMPIGHKKLSKTKFLDKCFYILVVFGP